MKPKSLKSIITAILCLVVISNSAMAQSDFQPGKVWIIVENANIIPKKGEKSVNPKFDVLLNQFNIESITQVMPFAKTRELRLLYELNTNLSEDLLYSELEQLNSTDHLFISVEKCQTYKNLYDPADYMWNLTLNNNPNNDSWLWYLKKIEADKAWNITKGSPNIKVAVLDDGIDALHPDLIGKIDPPYNFYSGTPFNPQSHGTSVATILAAETVDQGQVSNGQMASIGYKTKIMFDYSSIAACVSASTVSDAKIISISWYMGCTSTTSMLLAEQEILNNGTSIIRAAGNGNVHCGGQKLYPFSGFEDPRTIVVSSTGFNDQHYNAAGTNSHYASVDLCAPGYSLMAGTNTNNGQSVWPYYGGWGGTSQSTPIVSGLAALILSVNPCLQPEDVQYILKTTTDPITDQSNYVGTVGTGRINAYKAVLMATTYGNTSAITSNTTWNTDKFIKGDLIIESGATLSITSSVRFSQSSKLIIKPGAKLIIDGGKLTNSMGCGDFWQGVEVWGTSNQHQYPTTGSTYQGTLILKNGGTIENAHTAATNWKPNDWNKIGGVIQSIGGVFKNNRKDIAFMSYSNFLQSNPNTKVPNLSYFSNTDFVSDNNFIEKGYSVQTHVTLWEVSGINFTNCHFSNNITTNKNNSSAPKQGIYSINAGFKVTAGCSTTQPFGIPCPNSSLLKSSFFGFKSAIEISGASTTQSVTIQQCDFLDNVLAISIDEFDNVSINRNIIEIGNAGYTPSNPVGSGINLTNSTGYLIEENTIKTNLINGNYSGINVTNGGEDDHRLYKNKLENLTFGTVARGINHNTNYQKGLQFLCNDYKNNITGISIQSSPITDGVRFYQGDFTPNKSTGNTFLTNLNDIKNSANSIVYYYKGINSIPTNNTGYVTVYEATTENACATSFGSGIAMKSVALFMIDLDNLTEQYNNLNYTLVSLIDGGNTEQFKNNIEIDWSNDAWYLREKLIEKSPYLSSDALLKAAGENVLPNGMLLEILLANPDATKSESFIEKLKIQTNHSFPEYMLNYVRNNWDVKTLRTNLEGQMSSIHSDISTTRNYIKYLKKSEEQYTFDERLNTMKIGNSISHKVGLIDFFIERSMFSQADSLLQFVLNDTDMKEDLKLIENYEDYLSFRSSITGRNLAQLDSTEIVYLQTLTQSTGKISGYAQNILCFFYDICFEKDFPTESSQTKSMVITEKSSTVEDLLYNITLYPNPTIEYANIKWEIYDQLHNAYFVVYDLNGIEILKNSIVNFQGEKTIDTRSLTNGVYIVTVFNNDSIKVNLKLLVNNKE